jgi:hypothetical protein
MMSLKVIRRFQQTNVSGLHEIGNFDPAAVRQAGVKPSGETSHHTAQVRSELLGCIFLRANPPVAGQRRRAFDH